MTYTRITQIICTTIILFVAIYDGVMIKLAHNISDSVSMWFASYSCYCVPVFTCSFLLGHFFGTVANKLARVPANMVWWKMWITTGLIVATCYDVVCSKINEAHMISMLPYISLLNGWNTTLMVGGIFAGKYLGTMSAARPAGEK